MNASSHRLHAFACLVAALGVPACATLGWQKTASPTAHEDVAAFEQMPDAAATSLGLAVPASAPCHRGSGHGADIVCPLVALDASYYATINGATQPGDAAGSEDNSTKSQVAEDE